MIVNGKLCSRKSGKYNEIPLHCLPDEVWAKVKERNKNSQAVKVESISRFHENSMGLMDKRAMRVYRQKAFSANAEINRVADDPDTMLTSKGRKANAQALDDLVAEFEDYSDRILKLRKLFEKGLGV